MLCLFQCAQELPCTSAELPDTTKQRSVRGYSWQLLSVDWPLDINVSIFPNDSECGENIFWRRTNVKPQNTAPSTFGE